MENAKQSIKFPGKSLRASLQMTTMTVSNTTEKKKSKRLSRFYCAHMNILSDSRKTDLGREFPSSAVRIM